jgi:putative transposase
MARRRRDWLEDGLYHLFARGSNRQAIFLTETDYDDFHQLFEESVLRSELDVFAWAFMPNHWHAIVRSPAAGLSSFMQRVNHRHALRFDRRWGRRAHLFENRFGAVLQETDEQLLWTLRYVVRNPVEAGICSTPQDARWTSFPPTAGRVAAPSYLRVSEILALFGPDLGTSQQRYVAFVTAASTSARPGSAAEGSLPLAS